MKKITHSIYPFYTKIWFLIYSAIMLLSCINLLFQKRLTVPVISFTLITIYAIFLLLIESKQGLYTMITSDIIFFMYRLLTFQSLRDLFLPLLSFLLLVPTLLATKELHHPKHATSAQ